MRKMVSVSGSTTTTTPEPKKPKIDLGDYELTGEYLGPIPAPGDTFYGSWKDRIQVFGDIVGPTSDLWMTCPKCGHK